MQQRQKYHIMSQFSLESLQGEQGLHQQQKYSLISQLSGESMQNEKRTLHHQNFLQDLTNAAESIQDTLYVQQCEKYQLGTKIAKERPQRQLVPQYTIEAMQNDHQQIALDTLSQPLDAVQQVPPLDTTDRNTCSSLFQYSVASKLNETTSNQNFQKEQSVIPMSTKEIGVQNNSRTINSTQQADDNSNCGPINEH